MTRPSKMTDQAHEASEAARDLSMKVSTLTEETWRIDGLLDSAIKALEEGHIGQAYMMLQLAKDGTADQMDLHATAGVLEARVIKLRAGIGCKTEMCWFREKEVVRVSGDRCCPICKEEYRNHPLDEDERSGIDGLPYLRIGCDGTRLKL